jgi:phosphoglycolate phosphatase
MPAPVKPVAFLDLDGPILDVSVRHYRVYADSIASLRGTPVSQQVYWAAKRRKTPDRALLVLSGLPDATASYHALKLQAIESPAYLAHDRIQQYAVKSLEQIALRYDLVLVTLRHSRSALEQQLAELRLVPLFRKILSAPAGPHSGWETKCALVREAGLTPRSGDFFAGDTETDILVGRALGITTVAVCDGIREEGILRQYAPDFVVFTLSDLSSTPLMK